MQFCLWYQSHPQLKNVSEKIDIYQRGKISSDHFSDIYVFRFIFMLSFFFGSFRCFRVLLMFFAFSAFSFAKNPLPNILTWSLSLPFSLWTEIKVNERSFWLIQKVGTGTLQESTGACLELFQEDVDELRSSTEELFFMEKQKGQTECERPSSAAQVNKITKIMKMPSVINAFLWCQTIQRGLSLIKPDSVDLEKLW